MTERWEDQEVVLAVLTQSKSHMWYLPTGPGT